MSDILGSRKRDPEQSKRLLLNAAIDVFAQHGLEAATIGEICNRAGLNKRMAYHYYGSKQELYKQAIKAVYAQFFSLEVELSTMLLSPEDLLENLVRRYYKFLQEHPAFVRLINFENLNDGKTAGTLELHGQKAPVITALTLATERGQRENKFRDGIDVTELLVSIFSLCFFYFSNHCTMQQFLGKERMTQAHIEIRIKHVVDLLLHGITVDRPDTS